MASLAEPEVIFFSTLSILQMIKDAQQQHGLRHGDYQRYRAFCSRRLRRVRKSLRFVNSHKSVAKHAAKFQAKKVQPELVTDSKFLLLPLMQAERAWAYAMQLKQDMGEEASRKRIHLVARLSKAAKHARHLDQLCRAVKQVDSATKLEAQAYSSAMTGCFYFEVKEWHKAMDAFSAAKTIYEKLSEAVGGASAAAAQYAARCAEMQPQLRYCAFNIGDESAMADLVQMRLHIGAADDLIASDLDRLIAETRDKAAAGAQRAEVQWCGHRVAVDAPAKVHQLHVALQSFDAELVAAPAFDERMSLYEKLLIECRDAIQALRDDTKGESQKQRAGEPMTPAQLTNAYLTFVRLSRTADRYLLVIQQTSTAQAEGKTSKPQDLVRLYDTLIQNLSEIDSLPGVDNDQEFLQMNRLKIDYFKAFRCVSVAEVYESKKKWPEALALYERAVQRAGRLRDSLRSLGAAPPAPMTAEGVDELSRRANAAKYAAHARRLEADADSGADAAAPPPTDTAMADALETWWPVTAADAAAARLPPLVHLPPDARPMAGKPLFFDLALNHVRFPSLDAASGTPERAAGQAQQAAGIRGMVKGWLWGGAKDK